MSKLKHQHQWGLWLRSRPPDLSTPYRLTRFCINGYCPLGQYRNGRTFRARPGRQARGGR
jgi:hypothetical protein